MTDFISLDPLALLPRHLIVLLYSLTKLVYEKMPREAISRGISDLSVLNSDLLPSSMLIRENEHHQAWESSSLRAASAQIKNTEEDSTHKVEISPSFGFTSFRQGGTFT